MCLILLSYNNHPDYRIILAANRDEFYNRPAAPLTYWEDHPQVLAGRDLKSMGTWMGISRSGRLAASTNYREPDRQIFDAPSRGHLISDYLIDDAPPDDYLNQIKTDADRYNGFNLLVGDKDALYYYSNRSDGVVRLEPGIYGLSNRLLDTRWPKVSQGKKGLSALIDPDRDLPRERILDLLQSRQRPVDGDLPDTGVGIEWERTLSPMFITSPDYGTRCSTLLTMDRANHVEMTEITWRPARATPTSQVTKAFQFTIDTE